MKRQTSTTALALLFLLLAPIPSSSAFTVLGTGTGALLGSDITDPENDATHEGANFNATLFNSGAEGFPATNNGNPFDIFTNAVGGNGEKFCCDGATFFIGAILPESYILTHFTLSSSNDSPGRDPDVYQIQGSNDTTDGSDGTWTDIYVYDNNDAAATQNRNYAGNTQFTERNQVLRFDSTGGAPDFTPPPPYRAFRINMESASGWVAGGGQLALNELELFGTPQITDTDGDGMDDDWEQMAVDSDPDDAIESILDIDPDDNLDGDNLTNLEESMIPRTDPLDEDSDDDGLLDHVETGDGSFDSLLTDTGTNPNSNDTDGDGLLDGVETNDDSNDGPTDTGTDPLLADSDGDGTDDKDEIDGGYDPNDENSAPFFIAILGTGTGALLGGDLTDPEDDGVGTEDTAGTNFNWVAITASSKPYFSDENPEGVDEGAFDIFDNKVASGEAKWCCDGAPQDVTVEFESPVTLTHFTIASTNDSPLRDPLTWAISGSNDGVNFTTIFGRDSDTAIWTARNQVVRIDMGTEPPAYKFIRYDVTRTGSNEHGLAEIEYFGKAGPSAPILITEIDYDPIADTFRFTWDSKAGKEYTLRWSPDLVNWDADVNDGIASQGGSTTYPPAGDPAEPNPGTTVEDGQPNKIFFRVEENPPQP